MQASHVPLSRLHSNVAELSSELNSNVAEVEFDGLLGAKVIIDSGTSASTSHM